LKKTESTGKYKKGEGIPIGRTFNFDREKSFNKLGGDRDWGKKASRGGKNVDTQSLHKGQKKRPGVKQDGKRNGGHFSVAKKKKNNETTGVNRRTGNGWGGSETSKKFGGN